MLVAICRRVLTQIDSSGCNRCHAAASVAWLLDDCTVLQPDIVVLCGDEPECFIDRPPLLIIEVLSNSTQLKDRNHKRDLYREAGVKHYLLG